MTRRITQHFVRLTFFYQIKTQSASHYFVVFQKMSYFVLNPKFTKI